MKISVSAKICTQAFIIAFFHANQKRNDLSVHQLVNDKENRVYPYNGILFSKIR